MVKKQLKEEKAKRKALEKALKKEKAGLGERSKKEEMGSKPKGHKYSSWLIKMAISLQVLCGLSYRQTKTSLSKTLLLLGLKISSPSASTIRQWVQKQGLYELKAAQEREKARASVLIMDECAGIGEEKVLLILSVPIEKWLACPKSLEYRDTSVITVESKKSWKGVDIGKVLKRIKSSSNGQVKYVICDGCGVLRKGCEISKMTRVLDCTHRMSSLMERYYKKEEGFMALQKHLGIARQKMVNSSKVGMIAPSMRCKARFLNLFEIVEWMEKILSCWKWLKKEEKEAVFFIKEQPDLVQELICMIKAIKQLSKLLKTEGIVLESESEVKKIFCALRLQTANVKRFEEDMLEYIRETRNSLPEEQRILCCSDVIESYFGKFKYRGNKAASQGITADALVMPLFKDELTQQGVQDGMESVSWRDVNFWVAKNMVTSFTKTKQLFWQKMKKRLGEK